MAKKKGEEKKSIYNYWGHKHPTVPFNGMKVIHILSHIPPYLGRFLYITHCDFNVYNK